MEHLHYSYGVTLQGISTEILRILEKKPDVHLCLLFGSASKNKLRTSSDVDIAICGDESFSSECLAELQLELAEQLGMEVDLLDIARLNGLILRQVITTGIKILNKKPNLLAHYLKKMLFYTEDMLPNFRMMLKAKVKRFANGH